MAHRGNSSRELPGRAAPMCTRRAVAEEIRTSTGASAIETSTRRSMKPSRWPATTRSRWFCPLRASSCGSYFTSGIREPIWRPSRPRAHREISFGAGRHCPAKLCTSCRTDSVRQEAALGNSTDGTKQTDRHRDPTRVPMSGDSSTGSTSSRAIRPRSSNRSHEAPSMPPTATAPFSLRNSGPLPPGTASRSCPAVRSRNRRVRILVGSASAILTIGAENECPARVVGAGPRGDVLPLRRCAWGESRSGLRVLVA